MKLSRELVVSRMTVIMHFDETELIKCNALTKISFNIIRGFLCVFSKRVCEKSARKKCRKKVPENRNFQRKNRKNIQYIQQTNSQKRLLVFLMEENMNRTKEIKIRLDETELIKLNALTKESGRSRESYLRSLINGIVPCNKPSKEYLEVLSELRHIGTNMNQIARVANKSSYIDYKKYSDNVDLLFKDIAKIRVIASQGKPIYKKE